jgi:uncharacterized protein (TIGR04551 family)
MRRRHRSNVLFPLALLAPLLSTALALAQGNASAPPTAAAAPSSAATAAPDQPSTPTNRPALMPAAPASAAAPSSTAASASVTAIAPARDQRDLANQGTQRPAAGEMVDRSQEVFSDDWWGRARPIIELHGYFRTRAELFHNFSLGRHNSSNLPGGDSQYLWPMPLDNSYTNASNSAAHSLLLCGPTAPSPGQPCYDKTQAGANLRLRIDPEIAISDNLRVVTQLDLLDNLVLGSTPDAYAMQPATSQSSQNTTGASAGPKYPNGYQSAGVNGYAPLSVFSTTQGPPTAGVNSWTNSIAVKRAWAEYMTPVGQIRFGRMPSQWGLGMVQNSGDGIDSDYQTTLDRIMFVTGLKSMDLYLGGAWDFLSTGPTNANAFDVYGGQPYNTCNLCNVNEWAAFLAHRTNPELQKLQLARGDLVINGGVYATYRSQYIDVKTNNNGQASQTPLTIAAADPAADLEPRQAWLIIPDLWVQALWQKFRFEAEAVTIQGQIGYVPSLNTSVANPVNVRQYGITTQTEVRAVDDKLDLQFGFGWASGDPYAYNTSSSGNAGALQPPNGLQPQYSQGGQASPISTFRFHPDYRIDLIFFRNILTRVEGAYYFRPSIDYDLLRHADGEKLGGGVAAIWSRASEFEQTPGHKRDLGIELDAQLYYQSKDGSLNDDPTKIGGFFAMLQYGVFFPLGGLNYLPGLTPVPGFDASLSAAQIARLFLGVAY